ncbi:class I SAM-dependent methyltransferase [Salipiger mucosus]|uniref:SAM-dependent methyltransferase n=1 Tax=Salipiger mucosus DSM 16094 TaxID=1123237 RepID=S9REL7_9RHOB|nr:methyltransferase domain-containing protein [Salipiger mucosus]EPX76570.1 SAM-dependent methyltransferase [Salipiger mucosus DSM 16094]
MLGEGADDHWYYQSKARMITHHFHQRPSSILDVGAGLGWFSRWLLENDRGDGATCVDPGYETESEEKLPNGRTVRYVRETGESDADLVLLMDVLEHVDDDVALLSTYWDLAPPGATFIITVPAFEFLWSAHDDYLEHRRRYTVRSLERTIRAAGATPERLHYYFGAIFPLAAAVRLLKRGRTSETSDMRPAGPVANGLLKGICGAETAVMKLNRLGGLSVVAVLRKPA